MPIKLIPPRKGFTPNYYGRGTHLGVFVDRSTGTDRPALAKRVIKDWERDIERGRFAEKQGPTFMSAAVAYMKLGGENRPLAKLIAHFGETPLKDIGQAEIDAAAVTLFPDHSNATRNREVYTPVSSVLKHAGLDFRIRRPEGARGRELTGWLWPEQAERLLIAAYELDHEFGLMLQFFLYTGLRRSEVMLWFKTDNLRLAESFAYIPKSKNGNPVPVYLPASLVAALANHPRGLERPGERVFRFQPGGHVYDMLNAAAKAAGVELPEREAFHVFRHTHATWRLRYANQNAENLTGTMLWKSKQSSSRYMHTVFGEEAKRADLLPVLKIKAN